MSSDDPAELERTRCERDLYLRLLQLGTHGEIKPLLSEALALIVDAIGARLAYLELNVDGTGARAMRWFAAHGMEESEIDRVRSVISSGIIAEALATGNMIVTPSALLDPRFAARDQRPRRHDRGRALRSDRERARRSARCTCRGTPAAGRSASEDRATVELFARSLSPLADRLVARAAPRQRPDPRRPRADPLRRGHRAQPGAGEPARTGRAGRTARRERPADRRVRHRQEPGRARDPRQQPARARALRRAQLRRRCPSR